MFFRLLLKYIVIFDNFISTLFYMKSKKTKKKKIKRTVKKLSRTRILSKDRYNKLLSSKKISKKDKKLLDYSLFINYCKCIKKLKYSKKLKPGSEYPICIHSIYKRRKRTPPKNIKSRCKKI